MFENGPMTWTVADVNSNAASNIAGGSFAFAGGAINASSVAMTNIAWQDISSSATYCSAEDALKIEGGVVG